MVKQYSVKSSIRNGVLDSSRCSVLNSERYIFESNLRKSIGNNVQDNVWDNTWSSTWDSISDKLTNRRY